MQVYFPIISRNNFTEKRNDNFKSEFQTHLIDIEYLITTKKVKLPYCLQECVIRKTFVIFHNINLFIFKIDNLTTMWNIWDPNAFISIAIRKVWNAINLYNHIDADALRNRRDVKQICWLINISQTRTFRDRLMSH